MGEGLSTTQRVINGLRDFSTELKDYWSDHSLIEADAKAAQATTELTKEVPKDPPNQVDSYWNHFVDPDIPWHQRVIAGAALPVVLPLSLMSCAPSHTSPQVRHIPADDREMALVRSEASGGKPQWVNETTFSIKGPCRETEDSAKLTGGYHAAESAALDWWLSNTAKGKECNPKVSAIFREHGVTESTIFLCGKSLPQPTGYEECTSPVFEDLVRASFTIDASQWTFICDNRYTVHPWVAPGGNEIPGADGLAMWHVDIPSCPIPDGEGHKLVTISVEPANQLPPGYKSD